MRWETLVPVAGGRHCDTCRKTVIDVERLTSVELDALVESGERACVRVATLPDGSVLTRDHPRAPRRVAAWAGAALAASTFACSERIEEEEVAVCAEVAESEVPSVHRSVETGPTVHLGRVALTMTVGGIEPVSHDEFEVPPPLPAFDLTAPVSSQAGMSGEASVMLGSIDESGPIVGETSLPPFEMKLD